MSKIALVSVVVLAASTVAGAADIAFYVGAPNTTGWYDVPTQLQDVETIIDETGHLFKDIQKFDDNQFSEFAAWVDRNTNDGEMDILWINGCMPSVLYPFPNLQPDGSRIERWLDGGNMVINVADWFGYISYEGGLRQTNNLEWGAANILDLPAGIITYGDNTSLQATPTGKQFLPSLPDRVITYRPVVLSEVLPPWEVAAIFASQGGTDDADSERLADPVVIHNTQTGAYVAFINQSGGGPATWIDRGKVCAEFIGNWAMAGAEDTSLARVPQPADRSVADVNAAAVLSWSPGIGAVQHDVYFGPAWDQVDQADPNVAAIYRGRQTTTTYFLPDRPAVGQRCYWRIDEIDEAGQIQKGAVWSFKVASYLLVDGFESYDEACARIFYTWLDGLGHSGAAVCGVAPSAGNYTGSMVERGIASPGEQTVAHSGVQSLELTYDNSIRTYYSQTERMFSPAQDWTRFDVNTLTLYVRGAAGNGVQPLYVELADSAHHSKLVSHPDPQAVTIDSWRSWDIALSEFAAGGVDLRHVAQIAIGVGDRAAQQAGGKGKVYLDDIRLAQGPSAVRPVARWEFEEDAGTTASDSAGGHDGTVVGALWAPGKTGTALWFDGVDDYVDCGTDSLLNPAEMTLTLWVCPQTTYVMTQSLVARVGSGTYEGDYSIELGLMGEVTGWFGNGSARVAVAGARNLTGGEWTHLALTRDGWELALYMDGASRTRVDYTIEPGNGGYPLRMGGPAPYQGKLDDVRLYDRALSPEEIAQIAADQL
jgi:hypothetical protein